MAESPSPSDNQMQRVIMACADSQIDADSWRTVLQSASVPAGVTPVILELGQTDVTQAPVELKAVDQGYRLIVAPRHREPERLKLLYGLAANLEADAVLVMAYFDQQELQTLLDALPRVLSGEIELATIGTPAVHRLIRSDMLEMLPIIHDSSGPGFEAELDAQCSQADLKTQCLTPGSVRKPGWWDLSHAIASRRVRLRHLFHRTGLLYQLNLDINRNEQAYTAKLGYASSHEFALQSIKPNATILDLGAGQEAYLAGEMKRRGCSFLHAADLRQITNPDCDAIYQLNLNDDPLPDCTDKVNQVMLLDIIEHLSDPEGFLLDMRRQLKDESVELVISTPNVAFIVTRLMLLIGQFNYGKSGILDRTHCRLFTFRSLRRTFRQCGFTIDSMKGIPAPIPKAIGDNGISRFLLGVNQFLIAILPGVFSYQIFAVVRPNPDVRKILHDARIDDKPAAS